MKCDDYNGRTLKQVQEESAAKKAKQADIPIQEATPAPAKPDIERQAGEKAKKTALPQESSAALMSDVQKIAESKQTSSNTRVPLRFKRFPVRQQSEESARNVVRLSSPERDKQLLAVRAQKQDSRVIRDLEYVRLRQRVQQRANARRLDIHHAKEEKFGKALSQQGRTNDTLQKVARQKADQEKCTQLLKQQGRTAENLEDLEHYAQNVEMTPQELEFAKKYMKGPGAFL
jgi:hypothetical protein